MKRRNKINLKIKKKLKTQETTTYLRWMWCIRSWLESVSWNINGSLSWSTSAWGYGCDADTDDGDGLFNDKGENYRSNSTYRLRDTTVHTVNLGPSHKWSRVKQHGISTLHWQKKIHLKVIKFKFEIYRISVLD